MRKEKRRFWKRWLPAILTLLILFCFLYSCAKPQPEVIIIGDARVVGKLPNGNYEITPAVLVTLVTLQNDNKLMKAEIKKLREIIESLRAPEDQESLAFIQCPVCDVTFSK